MASRGRGIRRDLPKPKAEPVVHWESPLDALAIKVGCLDNTNVGQLKEIEDLMTKYSTDLEKLRLMVDNLHERSLADPMFGVRAAAAFATTSTLNVEDVKLRTILIQNLQNDFLQSDKLRSTDKPRFLNAVSFLGEICFRLKLGNNPILVLTGAHIAYQKKLLLGNDSDHELFVKLWAKHGAHLFVTMKQEADMLLLLVFETCLNERTSAHSRAWLMLAIELFHNNFQAVPEQFRELFESNLGRDSVLQIQGFLSASSAEGIYDDAIVEESVEVVDVVEIVEEVPKAKGTHPPPQLNEEHGFGSEKELVDRDSVFNRLGTRSEVDQRRAPPSAPRDGRRDRDA